MVQTLNFLLYEIGWFACVVGTACARPWLGSFIAFLLVLIHLGLSTNRTGQLQILIVATVIGLTVDSALLALGVFRFSNGWLVTWLPPVWMSILWMQFGTTFRYCLGWLSGRYALSSLLALLGAPAAFLGGERIGAVSFIAPRLPHLAMLGAAWAVALPVLIYSSDRIHAGGKIPAGYHGFKSST